MVVATADAPSGRRWMEVAGEQALVHAVEDSPLLARFQPSSALLASLTPPITIRALWDELHHVEFSATLLLYVALATTLEGQTTVSLDALIRDIGWTPRSRAERNRMRCKVWRWLLLFDSLEVHGVRSGKYRDLVTGQPLNLKSVDALIRITGRRGRDQPLAYDEPPLEVTFVAGPWLDRFKGNRKVVTDFGDIRRIASIPAGKPGGAWAQSIGLALHQRWRERAARSSYQPDGHGGITVRTQAFTRKDLLNLFRCPPYAEEVLVGKNPARARDYWDTAMRLLHEHGLVGYYAPNQGTKLPRLGWQRRWWLQSLDIRPAADGIAAMAEIFQSGGKGQSGGARARLKDRR